MSEPSPVYGTGRTGLRTRLAGRLAQRARARRYRTFVAAVGLAEGDRVLDVGCGALGLRAMDERHEITGLDRLPPARYEGPRDRYVQADARAMPFGDSEFDVVFCNSLIEHVEPSDREALAAELRRVGERYFVQTPNRYFPVEPHVLLPFFQFLPSGWRRRLWRFGASRGDYEDIRLLGRAELERLFPDARILSEKLGPLRKSLMAVGPRDRV